MRTIYMPQYGWTPTVVATIEKLDVVRLLLTLVSLQRQLCVPELAHFVFQSF
jgi:hypothetical protein